MIRIEKLNVRRLDIHVLEVDVDNIIQCLVNAKYRDATGRVLGIVRLQFNNLIAYLRRFSVPGFVLTGHIVADGLKVGFSQYTSLMHIGEITVVDISSLLYLNDTVDFADVKCIEYEKVIVSNDLIEYLEFIIE